MFKIEIGKIFLLSIGQSADPREVEQLRNGIANIQDKMRRLEHRSICDNLGFHLLYQAVKQGHDTVSLKAICQEIEYAENAEQYRAIRSKYIKEEPQP